MPIQGRPAEFIPDRLYYATITGSVADTADTHYFSTDSTLVYYPFEHDFGPLNLGQTYVFFAQLSNKMKDPNLKSKRIVYYSGSGYNFRANSVVLIGLFMVCVLQKPAAEIADLITRQVQPALVPFRDACAGPCSYGMTVSDCLFAMERAMKAKLFNLSTFKYDDYYFYSQVENGDLTWMLNDKYIAFAGPVSPTHPFFRYHPFSPASYIPLFKSRNVTAVVRLNEACYNRADFLRAGIHHYDLPFPDGTCPADKIIRQFIEITDKEQGGVAVHCKAGLGRTGTLIALYMIQKYDFTAREIIAWLRILRPGSILGQQQEFLLKMEPKIRSYYQARSAAEADAEPSGSIPLASPAGIGGYPGTATSPARNTSAGMARQPMSSTVQSSRAAYNASPARNSPTRGAPSGPLSPNRAGQSAGRTSGTEKVRQKLDEYLKNSPARTQQTRAPGYDPTASGHTKLATGTISARSGSGVRATTPTGLPQTSTRGSMTPNRVTSRGATYSPARNVPATTSRIPKPQSYAPRTPGADRRGGDELLAYGFGANGRVHPDVVHTPKSQLNRQSPARGAVTSTRRAGELPSLKQGRSSVRPVTDMY